MLGASRRRIRGICSACLVASALSAGSLSQPVAAQDQPGGTEQRGGGGDQPGGGNREQFRQRMNERMKQVMGASDEEWGVLQPKVERVMTLQRQTLGGRGMGMMFGGRGGRGGDGGGRGDGNRGDGNRGDGNRGDRRREDDSPVAQRSRELQASIENNAGAEELKAKLTALREARAKAREELNQAQKELRELLTSRQEAALVMMGMLE